MRDGLARGEDVELVGIQDDRLGAARIDGVPELVRVEGVALVDVDDARVPLRAPADLPCGGANDGKAWFGWPDDPKLEGLIDQWFKAADFTAQKKLAADIQTEAYQGDVPYVPTGQFVVPTAYRKNLHGIIIAPVVFFWNVEKD